MSIFVPVDVKLPENLLTFPEFIRYILKGGIDFSGKASAIDYKINACGAAV